MTKNEFIPYEQALALKELGFDEPCIGYWNIDPYLPNPTFNLVKPFDHEWCIPAPLYQQAFRWFRDKHNLHGIVSYYGKNQWDIELLDYKGNQLVEIENNTFWTYEEAELACLNKLIEIIKNKV